jgi:hypothetical protein
MSICRSPTRPLHGWVSDMAPMSATPHALISIVDDDQSVREAWKA